MVGAPRRWPRLVLVVLDTAQLLLHQLVFPFFLMFARPGLAFRHGKPPYDVDIVAVDLAVSTLFQPSYSELEHFILCINAMLSSVDNVVWEQW